MTLPCYNRYIEFVISKRRLLSDVTLWSCGVSSGPVSMLNITRIVRNHLSCEKHLTPSKVIKHWRYSGVWTLWMSKAYLAECEQQSIHWQELRMRYRAYKLEPTDYAHQCHMFKISVSSKRSGQVLKLKLQGRTQPDCIYSIESTYLEYFNPKVTVSTALATAGLRYSRGEGQTKTWCMGVVHSRTGWIEVNCGWKLCEYVCDNLTLSLCNNLFTMDG